MLINKIRKFINTNKQFFGDDDNEKLKKLLPLIQNKYKEKKETSEFDILEIETIKDIEDIYDKMNVVEEVKEEVKEEVTNNKEQGDIRLQKEVLSRFYKDEKDLKLNNAGQELSALIGQNGEDEVVIEEKKKIKKGSVQVDRLGKSTVSFLRSIIDEAVKRKASDIHIEPKFYADKDKTRGYGRVRFRENGDLVDKMNLSFKFEDIPFKTMMQGLGILSGENLDKAGELPLDFKIDYTYQREEEGEIIYKSIDLRCATLPVENKYNNLVIRLLGNFEIPEVSKLGLRKSQLRDFNIAINSPDGVILTVGPTGSGKTTTQSSVLKKLSGDPTIKIITGENPIENRDNLIVQSPIVTQTTKDVDQSKIYDNPKFLKACLRADPNLIVLQEIRNAEEILISLEASLTGHLVLSSFHANSSALTITRMVSMGIQKMLLSSSLKLIMSQRLLKKPCSCCTTRKLNEHEIGNIKAIFKGSEHLLEEENIDIEKLDEIDTLVINKEGCDKCNFTGVIGRQAIFEVMLFNKAILEELSKDDSNHITLERFAVQKNGMATLSHDALIRVLKGEADYNNADSVMNFDLQ